MGKNLAMEVNTNIERNLAMEVNTNNEFMS